jgi:hypothetical protein
LNKISIINKNLLVSFVFLLTLIVTGCKDDNIVENTNNNNTQNPTAPELTEPGNNSVVQTYNPLLKWKAFTGAHSYRVQLSSDANFIGIMYADTTINSTEFTVGSSLLTTSVNYYWRVIANLSGGSSNWSAVWKFSIILAPPPPPVLVLPPNGSSNQSFTPLFDWDDAPSAETYRLQISSNPSFTGILFDSSRISVSQLECPPMFLNTGTQYYWRVNGTNSNGLSVGEWSTAFSFTTVSGPEPNSISGTITFVDNNFVHLPYYYIACAFTSATWPPIVFNTGRNDSLSIQQSGNIYTASFRMAHTT